jgi:hypothetical protein
LANDESMGSRGLNYYFFFVIVYTFAFVKISKLKSFHIFVVNGMLGIINKFLIYVRYVAFVQRKCSDSIFFCIWIFLFLMMKNVNLIKEFFS